MIERDDVRAAAAAGILSEAQASRLIALAQSRHGDRRDLRPGDEPFELFKGFNEIFIVVGLVILTMGWVGLVGASVATGLSDPLAVGGKWALAGAVILWLLAEYFVRRRRMVAPAIALSILWAANAAVGCAAARVQVFMVMQGDLTSLIVPLLLATAAILAFWLRFKVPFALALVALGLFATTVVALSTHAGRPQSLSEIFLLSGEGPFALATLALGLAVFAVAMWFDMSDPHRVTRRASNGFWLHVVAAPAIVNTVALSLLTSGAASARPALIAFLGLVALVAIVIDRRSFLIAAVGYVVALASQLGGSDGAAGTILALGAVLLALGAGWERLRAGLFTLLPMLPRDRLPPAA